MSKGKARKPTQLKSQDRSSTAVAIAVAGALVCVLLAVLVRAAFPGEAARAAAAAEEAAASMDKLRKRLTARTNLVALEVGCYDADIEACPSVVDFCSEARISFPIDRSASGAVARALCPRTCGTCIANGTEGGGLHARLDGLLQTLAALDASEGSPPRVRKLTVGGEPVLVVDDLLPPSVVRRAALKAAESAHWQPLTTPHKEDWDKPRGEKAPKDERGLLRPSRRADGFPGIGSALSSRYEELLFARLHQLDLEGAARGWTQAPPPAMPGREHLRKPLQRWPLRPGSSTRRLPHPELRTHCA
jgi:hypothetical protein